MPIGGQLRVAHKGTEIIYDWSNEDSQKIEWAAFFSDCEHEVLEVTRGNRVTLTYNLFMSPFPSSVISASPTMGASPELYPLYRKVQALLEDPKFMANGKLSPNTAYSSNMIFQAAGSDSDARMLTLMPTTT